MRWKRRMSLQINSWTTSELNRLLSGCCTNTATDFKAFSECNRRENPSNGCDLSTDFSTNMTIDAVEFCNVILILLLSSICAEILNKLQGQHCPKITKPPQSLSLQMAERLLRAQPDSVANHHHSLLRHYYMRQHKSKRYKWQVHSKNIQKQRTTKKTAREHYRNIHKKINQQTEHKQLYCTYPHKTWPNGPFNVNTAWVSNHDTDCSISDRRALTWLATETGWARS